MENKLENIIVYLCNLGIMGNDMENPIVDWVEVSVLPANYAWTMQDCVEVSRLAVLAMKNKAVYLYFTGAGAISYLASLLQGADAHLGDLLLLQGYEGEKK